MITNGARHTRNLKPELPQQKQHSTRRHFSPANWT